MIFAKHCSYLKELKEDLNAGLTVVLRICHQADATALKHLQQS